MANSTLTDLTAASTLDGTELVYTVQGAADRKATVTQINASRQPLDATLTALSGLNADAGFLYQTSADSFIKTDLTAAHMAALRTFVWPIAAATNLGGGFYSRGLFRITLGTTDAVAASLIVTVKITEATDSGALYYETPLILQRDPANGMTGSAPSALVRSAYFGSPGTSVPFINGQFTVVAPNGDFILLIQQSGFVSPTVEMSALLHCPGDAVITNI